jgi:hypothetical protein
MFHLLSSGIHTVLNRGEHIQLPTPSTPFTEKNLKDIYVISMHMRWMSGCCYQSYTLAPYIRLVLRMLTRHELLEWPAGTLFSPGSPNICATYLDNIPGLVPIGNPLRFVYDHHEPDFTY